MAARHMALETRMRNGAPRGIAYIATVAAFVALVSSASGSSAPSVALECGQTVTTSVRLSNDLAKCPGIGLIVGAAGITVDLGGHTINGTNTPKSTGIENDGHAGVKVVNGTITGFRLYGVAIRNAPSNMVSRLSVRQIGAGAKEGENAAGILVDHSPNATVSNTIITNHVHAYQSDGIDVLNSRSAQIHANRLSQNAWNGLAVIESPNSRVTGNHLDGNGNNGMEANAGSDSIIVSANSASANRNWGLVVGAVHLARVSGNTVTRNGKDGLFFFDLTRTVIRNNRASSNETGITLSGGQHGSRFNQLIGNQATKNRGAGILVDGQAKASPADSNVVRGNTASRNGRDGGIVVSGVARDNRLGGNTADRNAGHGITAVQRSIDAGGNRAHGNKGDPQCVGVACPA